MKDFCVYGCESLIKAFIEEIENLGYTTSGTGAKNAPIPLKIYPVSQQYNQRLFSGFVTNLKFYLPQDWDKALNLCKREDIIIEGYEAEVKAGKIYFGCVGLSKETLKEMSLLSSQTEIIVAGEVITADLIQKLLNLLK